MSLNTFLGTISKIKYGDRINAVWHDLVDNYKEWFSYAHSPEDIQKLKRILKWRYLHNVQKVLYNHIKYHKNDIDDDSSSIGSRRSQIRNNFVSSTNLGSLGIPKRLSHLDTSSTKPIHETFVRLQMEALRSRKFDKDLERMGNMIMHREVPTKPGDLEIFKRYKYDPQHFNVLILSQGKPISDEKFEEMLPVLERNFQYISNQLVLQSRQRRIRKMKAKNETRLAEAEVLSKTSFESCYTERTDFTADFVAKRREILAAYIAKLEKTPTEILLAKIRKQKKKDQLAKKAEERAQRKDQNRKAPKRRRSLSALFRAPRQTHRERQALQDIQEEQEEGRSPKSSATSMCCHRCSKCGLIWIDNCSDESTEGTVDHICPA
ncbi:uncharacterized protein LOC108100939 [Drosophila ficusphila]|uniref:uncharacterized protein LOC108100939 n=1 Tax=Drosophila ficusphila TaxID=30025 RepID=UPI0007E6879A|nr:uncharacterized protein LOC108100939 [Drosophila ficusphila]